MKVLLYGTSIFCIAFLLHVVIWKIRLPSSQTKALLKIFSSALAGGLIIIGLRQNINIAQYLHIALFVLSMSIFYVATYSAIEADSPSLVMVMAIRNAGIKGLRRQELLDTMTDDILVLPRIQDLVEAKMIHTDSGKYKLAPSGILFVRIFILYRNMLGLGKGG